MTERTDCLQKFFNFLATRNIRYCVVGDTRGLPEVIPSDIDIVVQEEYFQQLPQVMYEFAVNEQKVLVQILKHEPTAYYFVLAWITQEGTVCYLHPDICSGYYRNAWKFLTASEIVDTSIDSVNEAGLTKGFTIPKPDIAFIYYLLKKIDKGQLSQEHCAYLKENWDCKPEGCKFQIKRFWKGRYASILIRAAESNDWKSILASLPKLRKSLHTGLAFSVVDVIRELIRKVGRVFKPTGLVVVFLGSDGCGKSSVINRIINDLSPVFRKTEYVHLRPQLWMKQSGIGDSPITDPHRKPPRSYFSSVAKMFYFFLDYNLGYLFKIRPLLVRSTLVVFDRYYYDLLVDPIRYRYGGPVWFSWFIGKLVPKPDILFLLDAPPEVLQARKQEVSLKETTRQRNGYLQTVKRLRNSFVVDASQPLNKVISDVNRIILDHMKERTSKRIGN